MGSFLASLPVLYFLLFRVAYRRKRLMVFMNPWADKRGAGFQIIQSFVALGSGGPFGVGLGQSRAEIILSPGIAYGLHILYNREELALSGLLR